jgi:hypothetical protein
LIFGGIFIFIGNCPKKLPPPPTSHETQIVYIYIFLGTAHLIKLVHYIKYRPY